MDEIPESATNVALEEAYAHAVAAHQVTETARVSGLGALPQGSVEPVPTTIYDVGGGVLFHDFAVTGGDERLGTIRAAGTRALGGPVVSIAGGAPGWDAASGRRKATEQLHASEPEARVVGARLVCYAYPKIAVELTYATPRGSEETALFDAASGGRVGDSRDEDNQFTRYSLIAHMEDGRDERLRSFERISGALQTVLRQPERQIDYLPVPPIIWARSGQVLQSPYCPNSPPGNSHYAQITDYFCVDASAQMLMEHYGWNYTQNQIAVAMGTTAAQGGTTGQGLTTGFASLTHNQFTLTFDDHASRSQQLADLVAEVDANRPVFTQVPHHYRVCMGYSELIRFGFAGAVIDAQLYIYDPWPWNPDLCSPGAAYWESWATSPVLWFGIVHHA